jgi:hypothetical protein
MILPIYTVCEANEHIETKWQAIARTRRRAQQRLITRMQLMRYVNSDALCTRVHFVRLSPRTLDEAGNLESAFKSIRDEIAAFFGVTDSRRGPITWTCSQEFSRAYGVRVELSC